MEIEFDWRHQTGSTQAIWFVLIVSVLLGLSLIGRGVTPQNADGSPKLLSWSDWRLLQAERAYQAELTVLRDDVAQLVSALNARPSPVAAQILSERISKHARSGDESLNVAREALSAAALDVRDWAAGVTDRDTAVQSVNKAIRLLEQR